MKHNLQVFNRIVIAFLFITHITIAFAQTSNYSNLNALKAGCDYTEAFSPNLAIPDGDPLGVKDIRNVTAAPGNSLNVDAKLLEVCININHTWVGDITVKLTAPNGVTVDLINRPGYPSNPLGCFGANIDACFIPGTGNDVENVCAPTTPSITGTFTATGSSDLDAINQGGGSPNGNWQLFVSDGQLADVGVLASWSLKFINGPVANWTPPLEVCQTTTPLDLTTFITGTTGGVFSGPGISGNNFISAGLSGPVDITYTVTDIFNCSDSSIQTINVITSGPVAAFTYQLLGNTISITNTTSNGTVWSWMFGDGSTSNLENPSHTYTVSGSYTITLNTSNACSNNTTTQNVIIPVCADQITDGGLEAGAGSGAWNESSTNFNSPLCDVQTCGTIGGVSSHSGSSWAWFGRSVAFEEGSISQSVNLPAGTAVLTFYLSQITCDDASDFLKVVIDNDTIFTSTGTSTLCGDTSYSFQSINIDAYADGANHTVKFFSRTYGTNGGATNFFVDDIFVYDCPFVGISESLLNQQIVASPNPAKSILHLKFNGLTSDRIKIEAFDIIGELLYRSSMLKITGTTEYDLDVSKWSPGIYFIKVYNGDYFITKKVIIQ